MNELIHGQPKPNRVVSHTALSSIGIEISCDRLAGCRGTQKPHRECMFNFASQNYLTGFRSRTLPQQIVLVVKEVPLLAIIWDGYRCEYCWQGDVLVGVLIQILVVGRLPGTKHSHVYKLHAGAFLRVLGRGRYRGDKRSSQRPPWRPASVGRTQVQSRVGTVLRLTRRSCARRMVGGGVVWARRRATSGGGKSDTR